VGLGFVVGCMFICMENGILMAFALYNLGIVFSAKMKGWLLRRDNLEGVALLEYGLSFRKGEGIMRRDDLAALLCLCFDQMNKFYLHLQHSLFNSRQSSIAD
jgi:hypothetical protein